MLYLETVNDELVPMSQATFIRMAHGDVGSLKELALEYFNDTRHLMTGWSAMIEAGDFISLREELHRCKGGASLFGLERIRSLIGDYENEMALETRGFDMVEFEAELSMAESAVSGIQESPE